MVVRKEYTGNAAPAQLTVAMNNSTLSASISTSVGWPTGTVGDFTCVIDAGLTAEEKIYCDTLIGGVLTIITRGYDGTAAVAHNANAAIYPCPSAIDYDEANLHNFTATAVHGVTGSVVGTTSTQTLTNKDLTSSTNTFASGITLLSTTPITAVATMSITGISQAYTDLLIVISNAATANTNVRLCAQLNSVTSYTYGWAVTSSEGFVGFYQDYFIGLTAYGVTSTANTNTIGAAILIRRYADAVGFKPITTSCTYVAYNAAARTDASSDIGSGGAQITAAITAIHLFPLAGNWTAQGNIYVYGVK